MIHLVITLKIHKKALNPRKNLIDREERKLKKLTLVQLDHILQNPENVKKQKKVSFKLDKSSSIETPREKMPKTNMLEIQHTQRNE